MDLLSQVSDLLAELLGFEKFLKSQTCLLNYLEIDTEMTWVFENFRLASEFLNPGRHVQSISTEIDKLHKGMRDRLEITISGFIEIQTGTE